MEVFCRSLANAASRLLFRFFSFAQIRRAIIYFTMLLAFTTTRAFRLAWRSRGRLDLMSVTYRLCIVLVRA